MTTRKENRIVEAVPPRGRANPSTRHFDDMAGVAKLTGKPVLVGEHMPLSRISSIRQYKKAPFVTDEGRIIIQMRNSSVEDGKRYGDLYFEWESNSADTTNKEN